MIRINRAAVKITHIPSGESAIVTDQQCRRMREMHSIANRVIRNRVYAIKAGISRNGKVVSVYDLPDNDLYPHELIKHKINVGT